MATEIKKGVHWVGVVDWGIRKFHGHELSVHRGTTYNSYLVADQKIALVDTVWDPFADRLVENIREVVDPARIDYIVLNHAEPDHAGGIEAVLRAAPRAEVLVSPRGAESVPASFRLDRPTRTVRTGERVSLGETSLVFVEAPMLHWPDSMFTYLDGRALLMPNDAFGQHYATDFRFDDEVDDHALFEEALKYYANILTPFSALVEKKIAEVLGLGLAVDMIAPSHGVIWRKDPMRIVNAYREWAAQKPARRAVVLYDTMWNATRRMAEAVAEGLAEKGVPHRLFHMGVADRNDAIAEIFRAGAVVVGSPTFNGGILPSLAPILDDLRGLKMKNKIGAAFGSCGWSGESVKRLEEHLGACKIAIAAEGVLARWRPAEANLEKCRALGRRVADALPAS